MALAHRVVPFILYPGHLVFFIIFVDARLVPQRRGSRPEGREGIEDGLAKEKEDALLIRSRQQQWDSPSSHQQFAYLTPKPLSAAALWHQGGLWLALASLAGQVAMAGCDWPAIVDGGWLKDKPFSLSV